MERARVETARAASPRGGVVLVHEVQGIDAPLRERAARLAEAGWDVAMPDLWWREGPPPVASLEEEADPAGGIADYDALAGVAVARDALPHDLPRFLMGFSVGGLYARVAACVVFGFAGAVGFGGRLVYPTISPKRPAQPLDLLPGLTCPLLSHFGADDPDAPPAHVAELEARLATQARPGTVFVYPGCGRRFATWPPAAQRTAWARSLSFLDHLGARAG